MEGALLFIDAGLARLPAAYIAVIVMLLVTTMRIGPAAADASTWAGACLVTFKVSYSENVTAVAGSPSAITLADGGDNSCVVQPGGLVDVSISSSGPLTLVEPPGLWSCFAGLATGSVTVDLDLAGFPDPTVHVAAVNTGGVIEMALVSADVVTFTGVAAMAQAPEDSVNCAAGVGHASTATWTGVLVFQDPVMSG